MRLRIASGSSSGAIAGSATVLDVSSATISGLSPQTAFYFQVQAYNALGATDNSWLKLLRNRPALTSTFTLPAITGTLKTPSQ